MNRLVITGLTTLVALAMMGNSFAQGGSFGPYGPPPRPTADTLAKTVGLTDEQVKKVKEVDASRDAALVDVQAAISANMQAIQDAAKSGDYGKQVELIAQNQKLTTQDQEISQKFDDARMAVLSDDQKTKLNDANDAEATRQLTAMYTRGYQEQAKVAGLSDDQITSMVAIDLASAKAVAQWDKENMDKLIANSKAVQEAMKNGDTEKVKELGAQSQELQILRTELMNKRQTDTFAIMTNAQKATWIEYSVLLTFFPRSQAYKFTADQKSKIKQACHTLAQEKGATSASLYAKLELETFSNIMTNDQKMTYLQKAVLQGVNGLYYSAKLTDDQKAKVKEDYIKLVADNGTPSPVTFKDFKSMNEAVQDICKKLSPQVDAMLSNEQKAAQDKWTHPQKKSAPASVR